MTHKARTRWEADYQLIDNEGLFQEYLEMGELALRLTPFSSSLLWTDQRREAEIIKFLLSFQGFLWCFESLCRRNMVRGIKESRIL